MRLFGSKRDPLKERAESLVSAARVNALALLTAFGEKYPVLYECESRHGEFIITTASVFIAATRLKNLNAGEAREDALMDVVTARFAQEYPNQLDAFDDCKTFFEREFDRLTASGYEARFIGSDALGLWIVWNLLGRQPKAPNELELVRVVGAAITHTFFDWWTKA